MGNIWQGKLIGLRAVEIEDLEGYFCNDMQTIDTDGQRNGDRAIFPLSKVFMRERVETLAKTNPYEETFFLMITDLECKAVGNINSHGCNRINGTFKFGVGVRPEYRGKGYATEAIYLLLRFYFMELGYQKVETQVYDFNEESIALHEKLGFVLEGRLRNSHYALGAYHDVLCYGMKREEFEAAELTGVFGAFLSR